MSEESNKDIAMARELVAQSAAAARKRDFKQAKNCLEQAMRLYSKADFIPGFVETSNILGFLEVESLDAPISASFTFSMALIEALKSGDTTLCWNTIDTIVNTAWIMRRKKIRGLQFFAGPILNSVDTLRETFAFSKEMVPYLSLAILVLSVIRDSDLGFIGQQRALEHAREIDESNGRMWHMEEFVKFNP